MRGRSMVVLGAVAVAIAGCGGDDAGTDNSSAARPTSSAASGESAAKQAYIAKADAICRDANEKESALGAVGVDFVHHEQFDDPDFLADFTPIGAEALRELKALTPPAGDEEQAEAVLAAIDRMIQTLQERTADLRAGKDKRRADQVREYLNGYSDLAVAAGPLGLSECQGLVL
jgi:hypothetical protein